MSSAENPLIFLGLGLNQPALYLQTSAMRQNLAHSLENSEQKPSLEIGTQVHTVRSQSHPT